MRRSKDELLRIEMERALIGIVDECGDNEVLDIEDLYINWSAWDNGDDTHYDNDARNCSITALSLEHTWDGDIALWVTIVDENFDEDTYRFSNLPFEDADKCMEYIYDEVASAY